ncbi:MAG: hypothetical protein A2017_16775 [Lentisphaerae bacterium GWF2_44_16]|nr:MAG: hypothetical protein A2017_16775 [Lentisphaerae bacterium GWF2_44_16]
MKKNNFLNNGITAHRGNSSAYPENTIAPFESTLEWIGFNDGALKLMAAVKTGLFQMLHGSAGD